MRVHESLEAVAREAVAERLWQRGCGREAVAERLSRERLWQRGCGREAVARLERLWRAERVKSVD